MDNSNLHNRRLFLLSLTGVGAAMLATPLMEREAFARGEGTDTEPAEKLMEIKGGNYRIWYDPSEVVVYFEGILRLGSPQEYQPVEELLEKVLLTNPKQITLDVRTLSFLNSSGINVLYKFAISMRKKGDTKLVVRGSKSIPWQGKSLANLKRFNQNFELILSD